MKRDSKSNNKGFSLVELIVVIAIMAVLMGVLAPTLIGNVEKSRESTDLQNLDTVRGAVVTAMSVESVAKAHAATQQVCTIAWDSSSKKNVLSGGSEAFRTALQSELDETVNTQLTTKSGAASGGAITITVSAGGSVQVAIVKSGAVVECKKTKDEDGNFKLLQAGNAATGTGAAD